MPKGIWIGILFLASGALWLAGQGCQKTQQPFGIDAPDGLDVPSPTPLPLSGAIVVNVSDGTQVISNLSVEAVSPGNAATLTGVTNGSGQVSFNPDPIAPGVWTLRVPAQSNSYSDYGLSQQFVTVGAGFTHAAVDFSPGSYQLILVPAASASYPTSLQNDIDFTLTYAQTGTLDVPVTYAFSGTTDPIISGPATLDMAVSQAGVTLQVPACSFEEPIIYVGIYRTEGSANPILGRSNSVTAVRGYPITITSLTRAETPDCEETGISRGVTQYSGISMIDTWQINTAGGCPGMPFHVHIVFSSTNDGSSSTPQTEDFNMSSGSPAVFSWAPTMTSPVKYTWTLTDENGRVKFEGVKRSGRNMVFV
jgi:hypothetical protein